MAEDKGLQMELYGFDIDKRHTSTCTLRRNPVVWIIFKNCTVLSNCAVHERERNRCTCLCLVCFRLVFGQASLVLPFRRALICDWCANVLSQLSRHFVFPDTV